MRCAARAAPDDKAFRELELKLAALTAEGDAAAADAARSELWAKQQAIDARAAEVTKLERERKFNADELCYVAKEKTLVGRRVRPAPAGVRGACGVRPPSHVACAPSQRGVQAG